MTSVRARILGTYALVSFGKFRDQKSVGNPFALFFFISFLTLEGPALYAAIAISQSLCSLCNLTKNLYF